jgi:stage II sporulation protein AA (anti-sigma F factor antagonist)
VIEIREERSGPVLVLAPVGRLDSNSAPELERTLLAHLARGERRMVVDMLGVEYISSAGLRVLLMLAKRLSGSGRLVLCSLGPAVRQVFELAGFVAIFELAASRPLALARAGEAT